VPTVAKVCQIGGRRQLCHAAAGSTTKFGSGGGWLQHTLQMTSRVRDPDGVTQPLFLCQINRNLTFQSEPWLNSNFVVSPGRLWRSGTSGAVPGRPKTVVGTCRQSNYRHQYHRCRHSHVRQRLEPISVWPKGRGAQGTSLLGGPAHRRRSADGHQQVSHRMLQP